MYPTLLFACHDGPAPKTLYWCSVYSPKMLPGTIFSSDNSLNLRWGNILKSGDWWESGPYARSIYCTCVIIGTITVRIEFIKRTCKQTALIFQCWPSKIILPSFTIPIIRRRWIPFSFSPLNTSSSRLDPWFRWFWMPGLASRAITSRTRTVLCSGLGFYS